MQTSFVAETNEQSYEVAKPAVEWYAQSVRSVHKPEGIESWPVELQQLLRDQIERDRVYEHYDAYWKAFIHGDPARAKERVQHLKDAGFDNVIVGFSFGGLPYEKVRTSMRLFAEKIIPNFK